MTKNDALMTRARRIDPVPAKAFKGLASSIEGQEALNAILESETMHPRKSDNVVVGSSRRHHLRLGAIARRTVAIGLAVVVLAGIATIAAPDRPTPRGKTVWDAELVSIAQQSPRLLLSGDEWRVTRADEFSVEIGEMTFENGKDCTLAPVKKGCYWMSLFWRPAETHDDYFADRKRGSDSSSTTTIDGHEAVVFEYDNTALGTTFQAMWLDGDHSLELRSDVIPNLAEFNAIAATLQQLDVDSWLSAMPASVVKPDVREDAIDRIVADIPIPSNVDLDEMGRSQLVREDYALEGQVVQTVVCGWIEQWIDATKANDKESRREAVAALTGSRDWEAMKNYGPRDEVLDVANAMTSGYPLYTNIPRDVGYLRHIGCPEG